MQSKNQASTSFQDLMKSFKQAQNPATIVEPRRKTRHLILKKLNHCQNKQNQNNSHAQSSFQKSREGVSEWKEEDVLKEYNKKRKGRQLQLSYNKFIVQITNSLTDLIGIAPPDLLTIKINYIQFLSIMQEIAFIKDSYQPTTNDIVTQLWNEIISNGQTVGVFILISAAILNIHKTTHEQSLSHQQFWHKYADLRYTRLQLMGKVKTAHEPEEDYPFSPMISQRSRTMAASRSKSKNKNHCLAHKSYQLLQENESLTERGNSLHQCDPLTGNRRSEILYQMAKEKSMQKRRDRKASEVEYQKYRNQLTFHPKIHTVKTDRIRKKEIQGEQDSIDRIIRGRVERQVRKIIKDKGLPYNEKMFQRMKKERYEALQKQRHHQPQFELCLQEVKKQGGIREKYYPETSRNLQQQNQQQLIKEQEENHSPIVLSVEVDQGRIQKLVIKSGQCYKEAASAFIKQMGLSTQLYDKLILGIQNALRCQLTQIDEDSFESDMESLA